MAEDEKTYSLGTDEINIPKILLLILLAISIFILSWYTFNVYAVTQTSSVYWALLLSSGLIWVMSKVIVKAKKSDIDFPNPILYEKKTIFGFEFPRWIKVLLFSGPIIAGVFLFMSISASPTMQILSAPTYQIVELTPTVQGILTMLSAWAEDFAFFCITPALICGVLFILLSSVFGLGKKTAFWLAVGITIIANPALFTFFHTARYGLSNIVASEATFIFGLIMTIWAITTRTLWLPLFVHASNNLAIQFFQHVSTDVSFIGWTLIIIVAVLTFIYIWRRRKK